jgi:hypothetical protein
MLHDRMTLLADDAGDTIHAARDQVATIYGLLAVDGLHADDVRDVLDLLGKAADGLDGFVAAL